MVSISVEAVFFFFLLGACIGMGCCLVVIFYTIKTKLL